MKHLVAITFFAFFASVSSAQAQQTCDEMHADGSQIATRAQMQADIYDMHAKSLNQALQQVDKAHNEGGDMDAAWQAVVTNRDQLKTAGTDAIKSLRALHAFNLKYANAGCVPVTDSKINEEFQQSIKPFQANMIKLNNIPDDWRQYKAKPRAQNSETCKKLADNVKTQDANGQAFASKYDPLIAAYDAKYQQLLLVPDHSKPVYAKLRNQVLTARDAAMPGVMGYPAILQVMFDLTIERNNAGCIHMSDEALQGYRRNNKQLHGEIQEKQNQMASLETTFPPPSPELALRKESEAPLVQINKPEPEIGEIRLRNGSSNILCIAQEGAEEPICNLFPGQMREVHAIKVRVFGGGYWSPDGTYSDMTLCRDFMPIPGDKEQYVQPGLESNCEATVIHNK